MKRLLYPLVASALVTIAPYLITFETGQDITRGLFGFSIFALLLLFVWVRDAKPSLTRPQLTRALNIVCIAAMVLIVAAMVAISYMDLFNLIAAKIADVGSVSTKPHCAEGEDCVLTVWQVLSARPYLWAVPVLSCAIAIAMMKPIRRFEFSTINLILFVALVLHLFAYNQYAAQPLAQFPVVEFLAREAPQPPDRKNLPESVKAKYDVVTDSVSITKNYLDTARSNVVILVESWGIPLKQAPNELKSVADFRCPAANGESLGCVRGVHSRMYSRTRTAEREDLALTVTRNELSRDTAFIPNHLDSLGYKTAFLFGGDSAEQWRYKYIRNIGFKDVYWGNAFATGSSDSAIFNKIDSLLSAQGSAKYLIATTTRNTKFPLKDSLGAEIRCTGGTQCVEKLNKAYMQRLTETLRAIEELAKRHPSVRFIIQGDHEPILSPVEFEQQFYKRHVPFVVLN